MLDAGHGPLPVVLILSFSSGLQLLHEMIVWRSDYLDLGLFPEQIATRYGTITLEQVYATLTYYWHNQAQVDAYLRAVDEEVARQRREQDLHPSPALQRLRKLAAERNQKRLGI